MLKKRIIPCLDIKDGRTVKGVNFGDIKDAGDPIELAKRYVEEEADELVFLDISATIEKRKTLVTLVEKLATEINIPFTVGGGINTLEDARTVIAAGADKVSINSAALKNTNLITDIANEFGTQCVVLAVDVKYIDDEWMVYASGGKIATHKRAIDWIQEGVQNGAGEILLTSMNNDGTQNGFALDITAQIASLVDVPIIASGGAGTMQDFENVFCQTKATGALAASVFHFSQISIPDLKQYLKTKNIAIR